MYAEESKEETVSETAMVHGDGVLVGVWDRWQRGESSKAIGQVLETEGSVIHQQLAVSEVAFLPENNEQDRILTFDEQRNYLAAASDTLKDVAGLMMETGMRPEEVYRTMVANVDLEHSSLFIPFGKTKAARRRLPLTSAAVDILKRRVQDAEGPYLFPHRKDPNKPMLKSTTPTRRH